MTAIKEIKFNCKFDCIICLNSNLPSKTFFNKFQGVKLLAADGAAIRLFKKGIIADFVIGDLDSFNQSDLKNDFEQEKVIYDSSQETNDFQKVLDFALKKGYKNALVVGFQGGELEHTLNNWNVLLKYTKLLNLCVYDKNRYAIPLEGAYKLNCKKNEIISLIPHKQALVTTRNLKWELHNELLEFAARDAVRNRAIADFIILEIKKGSILLFFDARIPFAPKK